MAGNPTTEEDVMFYFPDESGTNRYQAKIFLNGSPYTALAEGPPGTRIGTFFGFAPSNYNIFKISGWIRRIQ